MGRSWRICHGVLQPCASLSGDRTWSRCDCGGGSAACRIGQLCRATSALGGRDVSLCLSTHLGTSLPSPVRLKRCRLPARQPWSAIIHSAVGRLPSRTAATVKSLTWPSVMKNFSSLPQASVTACNLVFSPPFVRPIKRPRWPSAPPVFARRLGAVRCAFRYLHGHARTNGACPLTSIMMVFWSPPREARRPSSGQRPRCHPTASSDCKGTWRAILPRRARPSQPIAIDEDNAAQHPPVIDPRLAMALRAERLKPLHLRVGQPKKDCSS